MQAIILAAGKSTRTYPITLTRPKCLVKIGNKPIIQHNLENLAGLADEAIVVVGYMKEMVMGFLGKEFLGIKITYVEQEEQLGTGHALLAAEKSIKGRFMVMMGDDIYYRKGMESLLSHKNTLLVQKVKDPSRFGVWLSKDGLVSGFAEKPKDFVSDLANCGLYVLEPGIFQEIKRLEKSERGEYELNEAVNNYSKKTPVKCVDAEKGWLSVGYPWDILNANERLLDEMEHPKVEGEIEAHVMVKGSVSIDKGTVILSGSYIEGPVMIGEGCRIGPNCHIRPKTSIGNGCHVGNAVEIKNCVIGDNVSIGHLSYFGDSVLGCHINIGAGTISANLRHDNESVKMFVKDGIVDSQRRKLGVVIGDGVHTGINTCIYPGRKIWPNRHTLPAEVVAKDKI
ncbi:MAG TPA: bifunctional sugar-1-phosphate nucleotidylyltransferase/acetyltransferase [archaeon]|jgi:bifunctional UDP-N-acetylglucosamine pyrophosphorylase/glucosamine-1-phosphate N-acetyltransferase|nr:bifunctional sugar-1-phosphate nucleotidylyltransferase/acetyltransferase [archaeon]